MPLQGGGRFCLTGPLRQASICHCRDCFQIAGLSWGAASVPDESFDLTAQQTLGWYDSSGSAKRGFCQNCDASLFYSLNGISQTSVAIGMLDDANDLLIVDQIFANSHPHWDRLRPHDLPHLDDQFRGKKVVRPLSRVMLAARQLQCSAVRRQIAPRRLPALGLLQDH